jgi:nitroimidazol reductase NimA-like FMN-containing flavoprotein (pyridoxamine 5'-phosphate oxidase superfamily)
MENNHPHKGKSHLHAGGGPHRAGFHKVALREMTADEIDTLMKTSPSGRLGTIGPDGPYIVPMAFAWYDGKVYFHCHTSGKKVNNIAGDDRVCFQVDTHSPDTMSYRSVIVMGRAKLVEGEEVMAAMRNMMEKYGAEMKMPDAPGMAGLIKAYKIVDASITGKLSAVSK